LIRVAASSNSVNRGLSGSGTSLKKEMRALSKVVSLFTEHVTGREVAWATPDASGALLDMLGGMAVCLTSGAYLMITKRNGSSNAQSSVSAFS
jgi:hypothetical protein